MCGGNRATVRHAAALEFEPDLQLVPQRPGALLARRQALRCVQPIELAFDVVDPKAPGFTACLHLTHIYSPPRKPGGSNRHAQLSGQKAGLRH